MQNFILFCLVSFMIFSCGKSACDCKKEGEELTSQSLREKFSGVQNDTEEKRRNLDAQCAEYTASDYKECK